MARDSVVCVCVWVGVSILTHSEQRALPFLRQNSGEQVGGQEAGHSSRSTHAPDTSLSSTWRVGNGRSWMSYRSGWSSRRGRG